MIFLFSLEDGGEKWRNWRVGTDRHGCFLSGYYDESGIDGVEEVIYRVKIENGYEIRICEELTESLISRGATGLELHREKPDI